MDHPFVLRNPILMKAKINDINDINDIFNDMFNDMFIVSVLIHEIHPLSFSLRVFKRYLIDILPVLINR